MKKFALLLTAILMTAISANVFAQTSPGYSTGQFPFPGAEHTYSVNTSGGSSTYAWTVYKGSIATENEVTAGGTDITSISASDNEVTIVWATTATPTEEFILVVEETDENSCKNSKALPIVVTESTFDLIVTNGGNACYTNSVVVSWTEGVSETDVTYDHGVAEITYEIEADGLGSNETWSFIPDFTYNQTNISETSVTVVDESSNSVSPSSGVYTLTGPQTATITVTVDNDNVYDNSSSNAAQNYTATLSLTAIASGTGAVESDDTNNSDVLTVSRPNTTQISFD